MAMKQRLDGSDTERSPNDFQVALFGVGTILGLVGLFVVVASCLWQHTFPPKPLWLAVAHVPGTAIALVSFLPWERWGRWRPNRLPRRTL